MIEDKIKEKEKLKNLFTDRKRTNILGGIEQKTLGFLVARMPKFVTPNLLTVVGIMGSVLVFLGFILAKNYESFYLLLCVLGLAINWFGDSLDGRIAYYRNIPRKWYGFSLDIIMDWIGTIFIGLGYYFYAPEEFRIIAFLFVVLYGWAMIISQLRYKITGVYSIDAGLVGPTEIRMILSLIILAEFFFFDTLQYYAGAICIVLLIINIIDTRKLLAFGDIRDEEEKKAKALKNNSN